MVENSRPPVRPAARSPRSAALVGFVFSLLSAASMVLLRNTVATNLADIAPAWLEAWSGAVSVVLVLVTFAGIAFLWFTGLIRDLVGEREDRYFLRTAAVYMLSIGRSGPGAASYPAG